MSADLKRYERKHIKADPRVKILVHKFRRNIK
jgi:hypothetical protein